MFFLKEVSKGINKRNIIFIEGFFDDTTKSRIIKKKLNLKKINTWNTRVKTKSDINFSDNINLSFLKEIKKYYFVKYKKKINIKLLNIAVGHWSHQYISSFLYKYKLLKNIRKKYPKFAILDYSFDQVDVLESKKNLGFEKAFSYSDIFTNRILCDIASFIKIKVIKVKYENIKHYNFSPFESKLDYKVKRIYLKKIFSYLSIITSKFLYGKTIFLHDDTLSFFNTLKLIYKSKFKFSYLYFFEKNKLKKNKTDDALFKYLKNKKKKNEFYSLVLTNAKFYMPEYFFNFFSELIKNNNTKKERNINTIISKRLCSDDYFLKMFLLKKIPSIKILAYQHGGSYGQEIKYFPEKYERSISDLFLSWGWKGSKVLPVPMHYPKLEIKNKEKIKKKYGNFCLFAFWSLPKFAQYIGHTNRSDIYFKKSLFPSYKFIEKISKKTSTYVRLPPYDKAWNEKTYLNKIRNIKFDNHNYRFEEMSSASNFVITNHFNTAALRSISLNIPTFICCDKDFIEYNPKAKKYLDDLVKANIFFYKFNDLYNFIKKNNFDTKEWWLSNKTQKVKNNFIKKYCLRSSSWEDVWMKKLINLKK